MKLKSTTIFTRIYLIHYNIVHLASAHHRALFSIHKPISVKVASTNSTNGLLINIQRTESTSASNEFVTVNVEFLLVTFTNLKHNHIQLVSVYHSSGWDFHVNFQLLFFSNIHDCIFNLSFTGKRWLLLCLPLYRHDQLTRTMYALCVSDVDNHWK